MACLKFTKILFFFQNINRDDAKSAKINFMHKCLMFTRPKLNFHTIFRALNHYKLVWHYLSNRFRQKRNFSPKPVWMHNNYSYDQSIVCLYCFSFGPKTSSHVQRCTRIRFDIRFNVIDWNENIFDNGECFVVRAL